jgi:dTDP-4-amino-4,6-dideoxygalactose transaminase
MPSFLCNALLEALDLTATTLRFFPVGPNLEIASSNWIEQVKPGSLVVVIDYFGFPCDNNAVMQAKQRGAFVLEDASQALLSAHVGRRSDFVVYSPRKILGVPDGGILRCAEGRTLPSIELLQPPPQWWKMAFEACVERREFDKFGGERRWYELFRTVEATYPLGPFRMSSFSEFLLSSAFDYEWIAQRRRVNYAFLAERLQDYAVFKNLDEHTVPIGFPVKVERRDQVRQFLFSKDVYPPVHWDISQYVPEDFLASHELSRRIMTIPCDHRLGIEDMNRIVSAVYQALGD